MYSGSLIEDLIATVARAESQARRAQPAGENQPTMVLSEPVYPPFAYQEPFYASMMGAA